MEKSVKQRGIRGQGMVEFAMVFPLLLLLLFGIFEFSRIMFTYSAVVAASREAARYGAAILDTGGGISQYEDCAGIKDAALRVGRFAGISDSDISIQYSNSSGIYSTSCPPTQEVSPADTISVTIDTSITPISIIGSFPPIPVNSSTSRTILKSVELGSSGTGAGSMSGALTDVNFKTTSQTVEETQGTISVTVELNSPAVDAVTVPFSVTGTAVQGAGADYQMTASPLTINPGDTTATIYIVLNNDGVVEGEESLVIGIDTPINATRGPQYIHTIKIVDPPFISFKEVSSTHAENSPLTALMIELSKGSTQDVSVSFASSGSATWGTGKDYYTSPATLTIPAGSLSAMVTLQINDDTIDEEDEVGVLTLVSPVNGLIGSKSSHSLTIIDDDDPPQISFFAPNQLVSEDIGKFVTTLVLSEISGKSIVVPYTISGTTIPADYTIHDPSPLTIPPGSSTIDIEMDILEGDGMEPDETLILTLGTPTHATSGSPSQQTIVITESSGEPTVTFTKASQQVVEDDLVVNLNVQLSNAWGSPVRVYFNTSGTAVQGPADDYMVSASPLEIPVGWTQGTIEVLIHEDDVDEDTENILVSMGTIENGTLGAQTTSQVQILDDDSPPEVSFSTVTKTISETAGKVTVALALDKTSVHEVTVPLSLSGSASLGSDYSISTDKVVIPAGGTSGSFEITVLDDAIYDPDEKVNVSLGTPINAEVGSPSAFTLLIDDNEISPCKVGAHLLTIGTDTFSLSMVNEGEDLEYTGGSVTWAEAVSNTPRLLSVNFAGTEVFSGSVKPPTFGFAGSSSFASLDTQVVSFQFDGQLGTGTHSIYSTFRNLSDGTTCSLTETFTVH